MFEFFSPFVKSLSLICTGRAASWGYGQRYPISDPAPLRLLLARSRPRVGVDKRTKKVNHLGIMKQSANPKPPSAGRRTVLIIGGAGAEASSVGYRISRRVRCSFRNAGEARRSEPYGDRRHGDWGTVPAFGRQSFAGRGRIDADTIGQNGQL